MTTEDIEKHGESVNLRLIQLSRIKEQMVGRIKVMPSSLKNPHRNLLSTHEKIFSSKIL